MPHLFVVWVDFWSVAFMAWRISFVCFHASRAIYNSRLGHVCGPGQEFFDLSLSTKDI